MGRQRFEVKPEYGRWTVIKEVPPREGTRYLFCECSCGTKREVALSALRGGRSRSCGCLRIALISTAGGASDTPERRAWVRMISRCYDENDPDYHRYGGRGIRVCDEWRESFAAFLAAVGPRPGPEYSIDRINNDGDYEPGNVRWATREEQQRNTRRNRIMELDGRSQTLVEWSIETGIPSRTLQMRVWGCGWSDEKALTTPVRRCESLGLVEFAGEWKTVAEWARQVGISYRALWGRLRQGWEMDRALFTPVRPGVRKKKGPVVVWVIGGDEVGTGAIAGPAAVGAVVADVMQFNRNIGRDLKDSKKMSDSARRAAAVEIKKHAMCYTVVEIPVERLTDNHRKAWRAGFVTAMEDIKEQLHASGPLSKDRYTMLIDGNVDGILQRKLRRMHPMPRFVPEADSRFPVVMAAAILAKVARDNVMIRLDAEYPEYSWCTNVGYGTPQHFEACEKYGVTKYHRGIDRLDGYPIRDANESWYQNAAG